MDEVRWLDEREQRAWRALMVMQDGLSEFLERRLRTRCGLSQADYGVLAHLSEAPEGRLRPFELGRLLRWEKSRLSQHLGRMEKRGLVTREPCATDQRGAVVVAHRSGPGPRRGRGPAARRRRPRGLRRPPLAGRAGDPGNHRRHRARAVGGSRAGVGSGSLGGLIGRRSPNGFDLLRYHRRRTRERQERDHLDVRHQRPLRPQAGRGARPRDPRRGTRRGERGLRRRDDARGVDGAQARAPRRPLAGAHRAPRDRGAAPAGALGVGQARQRGPAGDPDRVRRSATRCSPPSATSGCWPRRPSTSPCPATGTRAAAATR